MSRASENYCCAVCAQTPQSPNADRRTSDMFSTLMIRRPSALRKHAKTTAAAPPKTIPQHNIVAVQRQAYYDAFGVRAYVMYVSVLFMTIRMIMVCVYVRRADSIHN